MKSDLDPLCQIWSWGAIKQPQGYFTPPIGGCWDHVDMIDLKIKFNPRNLQQDPRLTDPEQTIARAISTYLVRGPLGFGPIQFLMDSSLKDLQQD